MTNFPGSGSETAFIERNNMTNYDTRLKAIKDAYLDLGVAISELIKLPNAPKSNKATGCKGRVENAMNNRAGQIVNIYQMQEILADYPLKSVTDAMRSLSKDGVLIKVGVGTYKLNIPA